MLFGTFFWQNDIPHDCNAPCIWFAPLRPTVNHIQMVSDGECKSFRFTMPLPTSHLLMLLPRRGCCHGWPVVIRGTVNLWELKHINTRFLALTVKGRVFVCTPCGFRKLCFTYPTTQLLSYDLPHIHYLSPLSVAAELPWLPVGIHAGLQASLRVQFKRNKNVFDKEAVCSAQVVLETHWGHRARVFLALIFKMRRVEEITGDASHCK